MSIQSRSHQYGTVFENWQILELLGQGSGGKTAVFRLKRIDSNRGQSALKVVNLIEERGDCDTMPAHLKKEYEAAREECKASALQEVWLMDDFQGNTNIVDYLDHKFVDWTDESGFGCDMLIRMELLKDLRGEIRSGKTFSEPDIIKIGCDICQALILCHGNGILHRDIKPENIFINRNGNYKLGDFGISRIISNAPMSMASTGIGTPEYAAPEQTSGKYDKRVDIYSLGLVLYELSNHFHLPFAKSSYVRPDDVNMRMAGVPLTPPVTASEGFAGVILKACAYKVEDRYQTAQEFLAALSSLGSASMLQSAVPESADSSAKVVQKSIAHNPYSTEPALGDATIVQPFDDPKVVELKTTGYETAPAIANTHQEATTRSAYETVPASVTPVAASKEVRTYETVPAVAYVVQPQRNTPKVNSVASNRRTPNEITPSYSKEGFEIQGNVIKKYTGSASVVTIPSFGGIDTIGERAFIGNTNITKVIIPDSIKHIKKEAFARCAMTEISLGKSVYRIEQRAFAECRGLSKLVLPDSVYWIEEYAFQDCMGLVDITLPDGTYSLEATAFAGCAQVKNVIASQGMLTTVRDLFRGSVKIIDRAALEKATKAKPAEVQPKSKIEIPNYGRVVKPAKDVTEYGGIKMGDVETDYRKMMDVPLGTYPNETVVKDPKGRERVLNHVTWVQYKGSEYAVMAQDTGPYSCMYFIFVVKNKQYNNPQFVTDRWRASCVFEEFKAQNAGKTDFKGVRYSFKENTPVLGRTKQTGRLSCKYSEMRDISTDKLATPISLIAPNNKKYIFDHLDTVTVSNTEYLVVAQPVGETAQLFFIFKKIEGTENHPIFISEGKAMRRAYRSFQERHAGEIDFDDLLEFSVPAAAPKNSGGAKHFTQYSAAHQYKDRDSIPDIIEIDSKYQIIDSFVFRQVCKGKKSVKQVIIPKTIQKIEANAFAGLVIEEKVVIPHSVSSIGKNAFTLGTNGIVDCEAGSMAYSYCVQNGLRNIVDVQNFKEAGVCQYCGSPFKGLFSKRCSKPNCSKPKDY